VSNPQRALWTFLFFALIGPFIASLLAALYTPGAIWANLPPYVAGDHTPFDLSNLPDGGGIAALVGAAALKTFIWTPPAAAAAALIVIGLLLTRGEVGWALAGAAGVVGFFVAYVIAPFEAAGFLPAFALVAGLVAALLSVFLIRINVLPRPTAGG